MGTFVASGRVSSITTSGRYHRSLTRLLQVPPSVVWVYLNELAHNDMLEFGHVLPKPGDEQSWFEDLPSELARSHGRAGPQRRRMNRHHSPRLMIASQAHGQGSAAGG